MLNLKDKKDKHKFYDFIEIIFIKSKFNIKTIKTLSSQFGEFKGIIFVYLLFVIDIFYVVFVSYKQRKHDFIFLREFNTLPFTICALPLFFLRKKLLLNVNHNFQRAETSFLHFNCLLFIKKLGFTFFCFESSSAPQKLSPKTIELPFLMSEDKSGELNDISVPVVGVVGSVREEKGIENLLTHLNNKKPELSMVKFILGSDDVLLNNKYKTEGWEVFDTSDFECYQNAIKMCDAVIFNYKKDSYYYRHSGVLTDAILSKKYVIAPNYPYFYKQLSTPVEVGKTFNNYSEMIDIIKNLPSILSRESREYDYKKYYNYRNQTNLATLLDLQLNSLLCD